MATRKKTSSTPKKTSRAAKQAPPPAEPRLYTLEVSLTDGPISEKFATKNPDVSRTIQIRGDQTLEDLHNAIFSAFDRDDEHMYQFEFGKRPMEGPIYTLSPDAEDPDGNPPAGLVGETTLDSLDLKKGKHFKYWFDFGDDWFHQIDVVAIEPTIPEGEYPKIVKRVGDSPPQYQWEEE